MKKENKSWKCSSSSTVIAILPILLIFSATLATGVIGLTHNSSTEDLENQLPYFIEPIPNKTVVVGRDVILPCAVDNLKGYKVAWIFVETQTILTIHHTIITKNPRFSLARHDHKHWYLQISDVKPSDRGLYMCQVNSDPMMSQIGFLDVQVPPDIIDEDTSSEVIIQEGHDVSLRCRAKGSPRPVISWKREDGGRIHPEKGINLKVTDSEVLHIPKVSRLHMGAYLCIASNNVPPSVSKRISLQVQFSPVLWIPNQLIAVSLGMDVDLECHTEAYPKSINFWTNEKGQMIISKDRFDSIVAANGYKTYMKLRIKQITEEDFGTYGCSAENSFGESSGTIKVYKIPGQRFVEEKTDTSEQDENQTKSEKNTNEDDYEDSHHQEEEDPSAPGNYKTYDAKNPEETTSEKPTKISTYDRKYHYRNQSQYRGAPKDKKEEKKYDFHFFSSVDCCSSPTGHKLLGAALFISLCLKYLFFAM